MGQDNDISSYLKPFEDYEKDVEKINLDNSRLFN